MRMQIGGNNGQSNKKEGIVVRVWGLRSKDHRLV